MSQPTSTLNFEQQRRVWRALGVMLEIRGLEPQGHTDRVVTLAGSMAAELGLADDEISAIELGAYLHDIGKLGVPRSMLRESKMLSDEEWESIRAHVHFGEAFTAHLDLPEATRDLILHHHERWDGAGYPSGLQGLEIPFSARLFAVVDAFVAMTADWSVRRAISGIGALYELWNDRGTAFEPRMVEALARVLRLSVASDQNYKNVQAFRGVISPTSSNATIIPKTKFALIDERGYISYATPALHQYLDPARSTLLDLLELLPPLERPNLLGRVQEVRHTIQAALEITTEMRFGAETLEQRLETQFINDENSESGLVLLWIDTPEAAPHNPERATGLFSRALAASNASVLLTDYHQRILEVSPAFLRTTGYDLTEVLGRTPRMLQGPRSSRAALDVLKNGVEKGISCQVQVINYRKDGTEFWAQISLDPIRASDGSIPYFIAVQHDITDFKSGQTEQNRLLEMVQDAIVVTDLTGVVVHTNINAEAMIGAQAGQSIWANVPEPDASYLQNAVVGLALSSQPKLYQTRGYPSAGWSRHLAWSVTAFLPDQRLYWVGQDTTELHHASLEQRRQHDFIETVLNTAATLVLVCDATGHVVRFNQIAAQIAKSLRPEIIGQRLVDFVNLADEHKLRLADFFENPSEAVEHYIIPIGAAPDTRFISWSVKTIVAPDDAHLEFFVFTGQDITERMQQEQAIRESEQRYRSVVESINDAILRTDANGQVVYSNPAWQRLSGYSSGTTQAATSALRFVHPQHRFSVLRQVLKVIQQQIESARLEVRLVSRASRLRWVSMALHLRYEQQQFMGVSVVLTDITDSKEAAVKYHLTRSQQEFYRSEDLSAALQALTQFLGAQESHILTKDIAIHTNKNETLVFQPDMDIQLRESADMTVVRLYNDTGFLGYLVMRWGDLGHLAETTTLLEYQTAFTEALERVLAYRALVEREESSREFIEVTLRAQEAERERIAIDLHDGPAQTMVSALRFIESSLEAEDISNSTQKRQLERSLELISSAIRQVRETITDLIPPDLEILGLRDVLRQRLEEMARSENWTSEFIFDTVRLPRDSEVTLYRIVIEALSNVRRHAQAKAVRLQLRQEATFTMLEIRDDGLGFDPNQPRLNKLHHGVGTIGMKKRAELIGAELEIISAPSQGTTVRVLLRGNEG